MLLRIQNRHGGPATTVRAEWLEWRIGRRAALGAYSTQYTAHRQHFGVALARPSPWARKAWCARSAARNCTPPSRTAISLLVRRNRPCHVLYHYMIHPELGWMYARVQTWFPFQIQVGLNGREWLAQQMRPEGPR